MAPELGGQEAAEAEQLLERITWPWLDQQAGRVGLGRGARRGVARRAAPLGRRGRGGERRRQQQRDEGEQGAHVAGW